MKACINATRWHCEGLLGDNSQYEECANCRRFSHWEDEKPTIVKRRINNLDRWKHCTEQHAPREKSTSTKVTVLAERKRA